MITFRIDRKDFGTFIMKSIIIIAFRHVFQISIVIQFITLFAVAEESLVIESNPFLTNLSYRIGHYANLNFFFKIEQQ